MFKQVSAAAIVLSVVSMVALSQSAIADEHNKEHRAEVKELKKEHRKEMREMRQQHRTERMLERVDTNEDGKIDLNEYLAHAEERFNKLDVDGNGFVTQEEAQESMRKMREEHKERRMKMRESRSTENR